VCEVGLRERGREGRGGGMWREGWSEVWMRQTESGRIEEGAEMDYWKEREGYCYFDGGGCVLL